MPTAPALAYDVHPIQQPLHSYPLHHIWTIDIPSAHDPHFCTNRIQQFKNGRWSLTGIHHTKGSNSPAGLLFRNFISGRLLVLPNWTTDRTGWVLWKWTTECPALASWEPYDCSEIAEPWQLFDFVWVLSYLCRHGLCRKSAGHRGIPSWFSKFRLNECACDNRNNFWNLIFRRGPSS